MVKRRVRKSKWFKLCAAIIIITGMLSTFSGVLSLPGVIRDDYQLLTSGAGLPTHTHTITQTVTQQSDQVGLSAAVKISASVSAYVTCRNGTAILSGNCGEAP